MIRIPGTPEWIDTGDARRKDGLDPDLSKTLNYPLLLQLSGTAGYIYYALRTQGQRRIRPGKAADGVRRGLWTPIYDL